MIADEESEAPRRKTKETFALSVVLYISSGSLFLFLGWAEDQSFIPAEATSGDRRVA